MDKRAHELRIPHTSRNHNIQSLQTEPNSHTSPFPNPKQPTTNKNPIKEEERNKAAMVYRCQKLCRTFKAIRRYRYSYYCGQCGAWIPKEKAVNDARCPCCGAILRRHSRNKRLRIAALALTHSHTQFFEA
jgi:predicted RNA-binding Zn-ribbon protein involved in translation (DUF1610 family)